MLETEPVKNDEWHDHESDGDTDQIDLVNYTQFNYQSFLKYMIDSRYD